MHSIVTVHCVQHFNLIDSAMRCIVGSIGGGTGGLSHPTDTSHPSLPAMIIRMKINMMMMRVKMVNIIIIRMKIGIMMKMVKMFVVVKMVNIIIVRMMIINQAAKTYQ